MIEVPDELIRSYGAGNRWLAAAWSLGRVLQNSLWDVEDGHPALNPVQVAIGRTLLAHRC